MKRMIVGGAVVAALAVIGCAETTVDQTKDKDKAERVVAEAQKAVAEYNQEAPAEPAPQVPAHPELANVGDSITIPTEQSEARMTVTGVTDPIEPTVDPYLGEAFDQPQRGNRFFGVTVSVENVGQGAIDPMMELENALVLRSGIEAEDAFMTDTQPWAQSNDAKIAPGSKLVLNLPYEAPAGSKLGRFQVSAYDADFNETTAEWKLG
jgi:hypothetical protein